MPAHSKEDLSEFINQELDEFLFESSKNKKNSLTLSQLKSEVTSRNQYLNEVLKMIMISLLSSFVVTGVYTGLLAGFGLFGINILFNILLGFSSIGVFYGSAFFISHLFSKKKIFLYQKEEDTARMLFKQFNNSDNYTILQEAQNTLFQSLEKTKIQKFNSYVYDFIKESIHRLEGDFNKLKYEIDNFEKRQKFSLDPFRNFFDVIQEIEEAIESAKIIQVINA